jgi:WD repeat-containing protein 19
LFLLRLSEAEEPIELAFQPRYGHVVAYEWFGDGYILLAFSAGFLVAVSTHPREIGHELYQLQPHPAGIAHLAVSQDAAATAGTDSHLKLHSMSAETRQVLSVAGVTQVAWSADGQLLSAACSAGICVYLARLPSVAAADATRAALLTSLSEVSVTEPNFQVCTFRTIFWIFSEHFHRGCR